MQKIFKYALSHAKTQTIMIPAGSHSLAIKNQDGQPCLWCLVDPERQLQKLIIHRVYTGVEFPEHLNPDNSYHIGTVLFDEGTLVYHYFLETPNYEYF